MAVVISGANFNKEEQAKTTSINYKNNTGAAGKTDKAGGIKAFESAYVSKGDRSGKSQDATYKSLLSEAEDVKQQIMASATDAKGNLKALFKKLSGAEAVQIDEDGFNLTDADTDECVNIIEKIKIELAMHCDDYVLTGTPIDSEKIQKVAGSQGLANKVAEKMSDLGISDTEENITQINEALETASKITDMSDDVKDYMVSNKIEPTINGIYQAEHVINKVNNICEKNTIDFEELRGQVENIIKSANLEVNEQNLKNAKSFLEKNIPVTKENLAYRAQLDELKFTDMDSEENQNKVLDKILDNIVIGESASDTPLINDKSIIKQVADVIDTLNKSDIKTVEKIEGNTFTVRDLQKAMDLELVQADKSNEESKQNTVSNYALLQEVRILMTADAGVFLAKQGTNLYTTSVYELANQLKEYDKNDSVYEAIENETEKQMYAQVFAVKQAVFEIEQAPLEIFNFGMSSEERLTLAAFAQSGSNLRQQYERAGKTYEAVGTQVRKDLKDSVDKAVKNSTASILEELGLEDNKNNREAIRILAVNSMDMTKENISQIKQINETLKNLIKNMKPETVLSMIRDNVNPLSDDIADVNEYLLKMNENATEDNSEKYSKFLYKLDKTEGITQEERKQFIGIYKMMNIFTKDAGNAIGSLVKQGADITMNNLMTAYESKKVYDFDVSLDTDAGMAEVNGTVNYYRTLFENTKNHVTPNTLKITNDSQVIANYSVEEFCDALDENYDPKVEAEQMNSYIEEIKKSIDADVTVFRQLERADENVTLNNLSAVSNLLSTGLFPKVKGVNAKDAIEKIGHREELEEMYNKLEEESSDDIAQSLKSEEPQTYKDISEARLFNHEIGFIKNLAMRHDYNVPVEMKDKTGIIHFTLVQDDDNQGRISVEMKNEEIGNVSLEAKVSDSVADIFVMQDKNAQSEDNTIVLEQRLHNMENIFGEIFDMDNVNIYQSSADKMPDRFYPDASKKVATDKLYGMAQVIVKVLLGRE